MNWTRWYLKRKASTTGIRLSELINLKPAQVNQEQQSIKVIGKGNKERIIPVSDDILRSLAEYLSQKSSIVNANNSIVFVTYKGMKLYPKYVYNIVNKYLATVTTNKKKSPHTLRHTFATHLANNGADINAVKELLGHSSLAATQIYIHNSIQKLKDVHKSAHPKAWIVYSHHTIGFEKWVLNFNFINMKI